MDKVINELFEGHILSYIRCLNVDYQSERKETFMDLQVSLLDREGEGEAEGREGGGAARWTGWSERKETFMDLQASFQGGGGALAWGICRRVERQRRQA